MTLLSARLFAFAAAVLAVAQTRAQHTWALQNPGPGVSTFYRVGEEFLVTGPPWDSDGIDACPPSGADDTLCSWRQHAGADPDHGLNGVLAAVLDGSAAQSAILLSDVWADPNSSVNTWRVNYDIHFVVVDPADLPQLHTTMQFQAAGVTRLTLNLNANAGTARVQFRVAPTHTWNDSPETSNDWRVRLTLQRTMPGQPAMIWLDNLHITEGTNLLYDEMFPLLVGDLTGDCQVSLADLDVLLAHFGLTGAATLADGDLDDNGDVDTADLALLLSHFSDACP
jgi:hypothetical protein